jgi:hypothetical protein
LHPRPGVGHSPCSRPGLLIALLVPSIAVGIRRLHDTARSGWWIPIGLIPLVGIIFLIVFWATQGNPNSEPVRSPAAQRARRLSDPARRGRGAPSRRGRSTYGCWSGGGTTTVRPQDESRS